MYHVSAQGVDERVIHVHYHYYSKIRVHNEHSRYTDESQLQQAEEDPLTIQWTPPVPEPSLHHHHPNTPADQTVRTAMGRKWRRQLDSPSGPNCPCHQRSTRRRKKKKKKKKKNERKEEEEQQQEQEQEQEER